MEMQREARIIVKVVGGTLLGVLALITFALTYFTVEEYERTVVTKFGKISYVAEPGLHFKVPFVNSTHTLRTDILSTQIAVRDDKGNLKGINTYTVDNQEVDIISTVFYRIPVSNIGFVYQNVQDYKERLFKLVEDRIKAEVGKVNTAHIAEKRGTLRDHIHKVLSNDARFLGLEITDFQLNNIDYTRSFRNAVEAAAAAKAMVETREQEKQQAMRVAERAKIDAEGKANAAREAAKGEADARLVVAQAEAKAIQLRGEATALAMRAQADALSRNPQLVEMKKAELWNGQLPTNMYAGAPIPFLQLPAGK